MSSPEKTIADALVLHGKELLKMFHEEYGNSPTSSATEFRRGKVVEWKQLLVVIYGESTAEAIVFGASEQAKLSVPPSGPLTEDGKGYYGFDTMSHTFIGPIE